MIRGQDETRAGSSGSEWSGWPRSADAGGLTDAGQGHSWPGGRAIWTGISGTRSWPASTTRTGRRCGGSGCAAPVGESPERTQW
jgi:hypothetical protein